MSFASLSEFRSRRLAFKFAALILLFGSALAAIVAVSELYMEYREDLRSIDQRVRQIEQSHLDSITEHLWVMDGDRLGTQLQGILRLPDIVLAEIRVGHAPLMRQGAALEGAGVTHEFALRRTYRGTVQDLGVLVVSASYQGAYERVLEHLAFHLLANVVEALLLGGFIFVLFFQLIGRHLDRIVEYADDPTPPAEKPALELGRPEPALDDELTKLVRAINGPRTQLVELLRQEQQRSNEHQKQATLLRQELLARKKIQRELDLMARVFEVSIDAILVTDADRRIAAVNEAFVHLTGYRRDEVLGHSPRMLAGDATDPTVFPTMRAALEHAGVWEGEAPIRRKDGGMVPVRLTVTAVRDRDDRATHYIGVLSPRAGAAAVS